MRKHDPNNNNGGLPGHSRRDFLRGSGLAAASAVLTGGATAAIDVAGAVQEAGPKVVRARSRSRSRSTARSTRPPSSREPPCSIPCATGWT